MVSKCNIFDISQHHSISVLREAGSLAGAVSNQVRNSHAELLVPGAKSEYGEVKPRT